MKRKFFFDGGLIIIGGAAIILSIVMAGQTLEDGRPSDYSLRRFDSNDQALTNEYLRVADSLQAAKECEEAQLSDLGVSQFIATVGFSKLPAAGKCDTQVTKTKVENKESCYFSLAGYKMSNESAFYLEGNKYMIASGQHDGRRVAKQIPVRYVKPTPGFRNPPFGYVLVPIAQQAYNTLDITLMLINILVGALVLYYAIFRSLRVILRISKGRMFSYQNTRDVQVAGRVFMALAIMPLFLQLIFYYVFRKEIPGDIRPAFQEVLWDNKIYFVIGFIILLIAQAFKRGHKLQKQNLSIS